MGIGFVVLVPPEQVDRAIEAFQSQNIPAWAIGEVIPGTGNLAGLAANVSTG
jgi:phosphoribosylformylglycinamidine cyclo-ligase